MRLSIRTFFSVIILVTALILPSCATNPVTGERELMLMTESQEIAMGADYDLQVIAAYGLYPDQQLTGYVDAIGQDLATRSHRPHLQWHFRVLDTPVVNAFAVPGGYIYVTRGLLANLNSEAELAMVLGHEIGHVTARHGAKAYTRQLLFMGGLLIGSLANETIRKYAPLIAVGVQVLFLKYSRDQERQADDLGVTYGYSGGYDPREFNKFFQTLNRMKEDHGGGLRLPNFLSTHPVTSNRIVDVHDKGREVLQLNPSQTNLAVKKESFYSSIDGIVYGDDPRQGYVSGGRFVHPDMGFSFNVPNNWAVQNTPSQVQMAPSNENALIQFTISNASTPRDAFNQLATDMNLNAVATDDRYVNGMPAFVGICETTGSDEETVYGLELSCVQMGNKVFAFIGMSEASNFGNYRRTFESTFYSFNRYQDREGRQPARISIVRVPSRMTVERFFGLNGVPADYHKQLMIMNSVYEGTTLEAGRLMKIIR
jgi:predicted Zn-dependent protease